MFITVKGAGVGTVFPGSRGAIGRDIYALKLCEGISARFVEYLLRFSISELVSRAQGDIPGLSRHHIESLSIAVVPLAEQRRVVAAIEQHLSDIDAGVVALQRSLANLKRYRASVLKAACEGQLVPTEAELARREGRAYESGEALLQRILVERRARWERRQLELMTTKGQAPTDDSWKRRYVLPAVVDDPPAVIPEGWASASVSAVGDVLLGRQRAPQYLTGKWTRPYLRVANVKDDRLDLSDLEAMDFDDMHYEKYRLVPGDILVSEGQSPELVGQSATYHGGVEGLCFQKTLHRFRPADPGPSAKFAQIVFRSHVKTGLFRKRASITTNIAHLTLEKFEAAPFPLPPLVEQQRIVAEVDRRLSVADALEASVRTQLARAARLRQSVLKRAFEGRLVPQDPADEPAGALLARIAREGGGPDDVARGGDGTSSSRPRPRNRRA